VVYLNRIYTRSGDQGETSLGDQTRVDKTDLRIVAYGTVDELNAAIGLAVASGLPDPLGLWLAQVQNDLFDLGADLCVPESSSPSSPSQTPRLRVVPSQVAALEGRIDALVEGLAPLSSFVLPGGTAAAAHLHLARTICRRCEIDVLRLARRDTINSQVAIYLNRLSDLLFVMARRCNDNGQADVLWVPGGNQGD
jgi:cob(I)alamin adenosyltransferase